MRDKHLALMEQTRLRIANAKGRTRHDLVKYLHRLKKELNRYDNYKRFPTIPSH
jgi:hypothetical protein